MSDDPIYLDHNATTHVRPEAARAVGAALVSGGNPSSIHADGRRARALVEAGREKVAALLGGRAKNVTFTSGATEALNLALTPALQHGEDVRPWRLFACATEHPAVLQGHRFAGEHVTSVAVDVNGLIDLAELSAALDRSPGERPLLALQLANNETGVIQPVAEAAALVHAKGGLLVCDAVQAVGRIPVDMAALDADLMAVSAHKIGGPPGIGALLRRDDAIHIAEPVVRGGGQEKGLRAGTENVAGIAGFGAAAEAVSEKREGEAALALALRDGFEKALRELAPDAVVFGGAAERLPNTCAFALPGIAAEKLLIALDLAGISVSSGSACSSGKVKSSHVLDAMGVDHDMRKSMVRVSLGWTSTGTDVERFVAVLGDLRQKFSMARKILAA